MPRAAYTWNFGEHNTPLLGRTNLQGVLEVNPLWPLEEGIKVKPVAYAVMQIDIWLWGRLAKAS